MDAATVQGHLMEVLSTIQTISQELCPTLNESVRPAQELPKFNSKVWPVAAGMLGNAIGYEIPCDVNIFVDDSTQQALTIAQTVALVCALIKKSTKQDAAAA